MGKNKQIGDFKMIFSSKANTIKFLKKRVKKCKIEKAFEFTVFD